MWLCYLWFSVLVFDRISHTFIHPPIVASFYTTHTYTHIYSLHSQGNFNVFPPNPFAHCAANDYGIHVNLKPSHMVSLPLSFSRFHFAENFYLDHTSFSPSTASSKIRLPFFVLMAILFRNKAMKHSKPRLKSRKEGGGLVTRNDANIKEQKRDNEWLQN